LKETREQNDKVSINTQILAHFKNWCRENDLTPMPSSTDLKNYIRKKYKLGNSQIVSGKLIGWKITYNN
jgi:hypothetical protein